MRSKAWLLVALAFSLGRGLLAGVVTLNDGSSISGELKEQGNGDVVVVTGAGEIKVAKDQIRSIIKDSAAGGASPAKEGDFSYVNKVLARREKYGNEDGLPRTANLMRNQVMFTLGQLNYTGDAYLIKDASGNVVLNSSDLGTYSYGLAWSRSFNDYIGWELWGDYSAVTKDYKLSSPAFSASAVVGRFDVGFGPKVQKAIALGDPEQSLTLIPNIGLTPFYAASAGSTFDNSVAGGSRSFNHSNIGVALNAGLDFQFGGALLAAKVRYLLSSDTDGGLHSSNTSAWMPLIGVGWAFY